MHGHNPWAPGSLGFEQPWIQPYDCFASPTRVGVRPHVRGIVRVDLPGYVDPLVLIVRNASTGAIVSAIGSSADAVVLPVGAFEMEVSLQKNVAPGIYVLETLCGTAGSMPP